jgi:hypothetical protein
LHDSDAQFSALSTQRRSIRSCVSVDGQIPLIGEPRVLKAIAQRPHAESVKPNEVSMNPMNLCDPLSPPAIAAPLNFAPTLTGRWLDA